MKRMSALSCCVALAGCVSAAPPPAAPARPSTPLTLSAAETRAVHDGVKRGLKDPYSAQFGRMRASTDDGGATKAVCGIVNAKNSYGGYVGDRAFYGMLARRADGSPAFVTFSMAERPIDSALTTQMCAEKGITP